RKRHRGRRDSISPVRFYLPYREGCGRRNNSPPGSEKLFRRASNRRRPTQGRAGLGLPAAMAEAAPKEASANPRAKDGAADSDPFGQTQFTRLTQQGEEFFMIR